MNEQGRVKKLLSAPYFQKNFNQKKKKSQLKQNKPNITYLHILFQFNTTVCFTYNFDLIGFVNIYIF